MLLAACGGGQGGTLGTGPGSRGTGDGNPALDTTSPPGSVPSPASTVPGAPPGTAPADGPGATNAPPGTPPPPRSDLATFEIRLTRIAGFSEPLAMATRSGDTAIYVAEKRGRVKALRGGVVDSALVLDISGDVSTGTDQGLLGIAFSLDGTKLYGDYTDKDSNTHIVEWTMSGGAAVPDSRRELLFVQQPAANDKGGALVTGPDGKLWIGMGDGGGGGDPADNAQRLDSLLGKILRIDPRPSASGPYTIPADNPFLATANARPEIWAYGLRQPWRISFDRANGDLWIADRGQNARDEVDHHPAGTVGGQNYGWARLEGTRTYAGVAPASAIPPIYDYGRSGGACQITGGYVYRGSRIPGLAGAYVFGDYCIGQVTAIRQVGGQVIDQRAFPPSAKPLTSFGQDANGELYALSLDGGLFRIDPA